jgi:hypothetical protein
MQTWANGKMTYWVPCKTIQWEQQLSEGDQQTPKYSVRIGKLLKALPMDRPKGSLERLKHNGMSRVMRYVKKTQHVCHLW